MCLGGSSKAQKRAAEAQTRALEAMAAAQKARTSDMISKTNQTVKTNTSSNQKRGIYSLRIPLSDQQAVSNNAVNGYGLNIPL